MQTKEIDLDERFGKEYAGHYVFQEISWAKRSRIIQKYTKYHPISGQVISSDFVAIQAETIWASLKEQPENKPITLERLLSEENGVPIELGELFSKTANLLCSVTTEETRFLSEQSDVENPILNSLTSDCAKSSVGPRRSSKSSQPKPLKSSS